MIEKLIFVTIISGLFLAAIGAVSDVFEAADNVIDAFKVRLVEMEDGYE